MTGFERDRRAGMNRDFSFNEARIKTKSNSPTGILVLPFENAHFGFYVHVYYRTVFGSCFACLIPCS